MTQYAAQPAGGGVAVQRLSLIQCYINFPIYAALVKEKEKIQSPGAVWGGRATSVVDACSPSDAQKWFLHSQRVFIICVQFISKEVFKPDETDGEKKEKKPTNPPPQLPVFFPATADQLHSVSSRAETSRLGK